MLLSSATIGRIACPYLSDRSRDNVDAMNLSLFVPDLFWPDTACPEIYQDMSLAAIKKLLAKSTVTAAAPEELEILLCRQFNVARQVGNWPVAPIMLRKDSPALANNNKEFWMRADPVHLRIEQNHLMLADSQIFTISEDEAEQLVRDINRSLVNDDVVLLALHANRWYIRLQRAPEIQTHTLGQVTCKNINHFLPTGSDSGIWRKLLNEIQMLLHEHPVNQARGSRGELSINSIWFWGGGYMTEPVQSAYSHVWSNHDLPHALAAASQTVHANLPVNAGEWLRSQASGNHLVVLDSLRTKAKYRDAYGWREALKEMETNWFVPVYEALKRGTIGQLHLTTSNDHSSRSFAATRADLWKFWLTQKPLHMYGRK